MANSHVPFKRILNRSEESAFQELEGLAQEYEYRVYIKVGVADVLPIENSGIDSLDFSYALKAHFDFLATDKDFNPVFAVEFDGPSHLTDQQKQRDRRKNALCARFSLPLLRINTNHLLQKYNRASLLRWIVSAWELQKSFDDAQRNGMIPQDEDFDPILLWHTGETIEEKHPHWIALKSRLHIAELHKQKRIPYGHTCSVVFQDDEQTYRGLEWIDTHDGQVIMAESAMRDQLFPVYLGDLFRELLTVLAHEKLIAFLKTGEGTVAPSAVVDRLKTLSTTHTFAGCHGGATRVHYSMSFRDGKYIWSFP